MKLSKKSIIVITLLLITVIMWFAEAMLNQYTQSDTLFASSTYNTNTVLDDEMMMHLLYNESPCDIQVWSYGSVRLDQYDNIGYIPVLNQVDNQTVLSKNSQSTNKIRISEKLSSRLFNSKEIEGVEIFIDGDMYQANGVPSNIEDKRARTILGTDEYIIIPSEASLSANKDNWSIFITGLNKDIEIEKMWFEANGIKNIKSTKYNAKYILKMVSLVKITIQWSFVGILIYSILIRIVDFTVGALHKKAI